MFSIVHPITKKVEDITYSRYSDIGYTVYWGEQQIGLVFNPLSSWSGWDACSLLESPEGKRRVGNFKTRRYATHYLLEVHPDLKGHTF